MTPSSRRTCCCTLIRRNCFWLCTISGRCSRPAVCSSTTTRDLKISYSAVRQECRWSTSDPSHSTRHGIHQSSTASSYTSRLLRTLHLGNLNRLSNKGADHYP